MIYTFGSGHVCPGCELSLRNCFVELPDREAMVALFGIKWANEYADQEDAGVPRFNLHRISPGACACGGGGQQPWHATLEDAQRVLDQARADGVIVEAFADHAVELGELIHQPSKAERDAARAVLATPGLVDKLAVALHQLDDTDDLERVRAIIQRTCEESAR